MSGNYLKTIAVLTMFIDHFAGAFISQYSLSGQIMHGIGRLTFPIMAYFIAEGFKKTSNIKAYLTRMGLFTLISHIPYRLYVFGPDNIIGFRSSIFYTFIISLMILYVIEKNSIDTFLKGVLVFALVILSAFGDYSVFGPLLVFAFYNGYGNKSKQIRNGLFVITGLILFSLTISNFKALYYIATVIPLLLLSKYNGEKGKSNNFIKYSFYIAYPLHLTILGLIF